MKKKKKVIVITGGNSGLGKATAEILVAEHSVIILGKNSEEILKVSRELKCEGFICDVTDEIQIQEALSKILKKFKKIDCLINCAGIWTRGPIDKNDPKEMRNTVLVNVLGVMLMTKFFVSQFKKQKYGRIINVSSQAGLNPKAERSVYNSSKWAVTGFTKCLQLELTPFNISVSGFYPSFMRTNIFGKAKDIRSDFDRAMPVEKPARALAYLVEAEDDLVINSLEMQSIKNY